MQFLQAAVVSIASAVTLAGADPDLDLILYGADGCVGHYAAYHLAKQAGLKWAVAGRTEAHLQALLVDIARAGGNSSKPDMIVAPLDGSVDPKTWVTRARAVITAAGPFSLYGGELLVRACAETGVHYSDTSDEFYWQRRMIDGYDAVAQQSGAKIVISSGFCVLAGDLGAQLVIQELRAHPGTKVSLDAWLEKYNGGISGGVLNEQASERNASYPETWNDDPYVLSPDAHAHLRIDQSVQGMRYPTYVWGEGLIVKNMFGPYDARLLRRSFVHLGQKVQLRVGSTSGMYPAFTAFVATHGGPGKCPDERSFNAGSWAYRFKASARGKSKSILLSGSGDPGYRFTSAGLAEVGLCLAGKTLGCMKTDAAGGVSTSMMQFDAQVMRHRLASVGLAKFEKSTAATETIFM